MPCVRSATSEIQRGSYSEAVGFSLHRETLRANAPDDCSRDVPGRVDRLPVQEGMKTERLGPRRGSRLEDRELDRAAGESLHLVDGEGLAEAAPGPGPPGGAVGAHRP